MTSWGRHACRFFCIVEWMQILWLLSSGERGLGRNASRLIKVRTVNHQGTRRYRSMSLVLLNDCIQYASMRHIRSSTMTLILHELDPPHDQRPRPASRLSELCYRFPYQRRVLCQCLDIRFTVTYGTKSVMLIYRLFIEFLQKQSHELV